MSVLSVELRPIGDYFADGFARFRSEGKFCDLVLHVGEKAFDVHKLVLAYHSEFFQRLLLSQFRESAQSHITLQFPDPENVFSLMLDFFYSVRTALLCNRTPSPFLSCSDVFRPGRSESHCKKCDSSFGAC